MKLGILIMAAGASSRYKSCKLLAEFNGKPMLEHAVTNALALKPYYHAVVTGAWHEQISNAQGLGLLTETTLLLNQNWKKGLGSSIAFGVSKLPADVDKLLIVLADQVAISSESFQALCLAAKDVQIGCALYEGKRGVPAVFDKSCFDLLSQLDGDRGAKTLLYSSEFDVCEVEMPEAAIDIDTPADAQVFLLHPL